MISSDPIAHVEPSEPLVHRLSYDDLHLIFSLCWIPAEDTFPIIASHVCRRWRWLILGMPRFWGHLHFRHKEPRLSMERYATWIQRSKGVQLDISINSRSFAEFAVQNVEAIMELIGPHMERWRSLRIAQVSIRNIRIILAHLKGRSLPLLERLRVVESSNGFGWSNESMSPERLAFDAPQLKELELVGVVVELDSPLLHHLHVLHLQDDSFSKIKSPGIIYALIRKSPHLRQLHIKCAQPYLVRSRNRNLPPHVTEEPFSHTSLVDLTLEVQPSVLDAIISVIRFPSLRSFCSGPYKAKVMLPSWHLPLLARDSPCPSLKQIELSGSPSEPQYNRYLAGAISTLVSLEELTLNRFDMTQVANALPALGHSCPKLEALELIRCNRVDLNQVRSLVDTRLQVDGMTGLRKFGVLGGISRAFPELGATETWLRERVDRVLLVLDDG